MARIRFLSTPALNVLKFTPQEKSAARIGPDGLTEAERPRGKAMGPARILALVDRYYQAKAMDDAVGVYVPRMRERVCVEGRDEVFVVIYVDKESAVADLVSTEHVGDLLESVPFSSIFPEGPRGPRAA